MQHYIEDNNKKTKLFIDSDDSQLFVSICVEESREQYDYTITKEEMETIQFLIKQNQHEKT